MDACDVTDLERLVKPVPQLAEHVDQLAQSFTSQSTGHSPALQASSACAKGHALPPCVAWACTVRERDRVPTPHVLSHASHAGHGFMTQSTGHAWVLHAISS